jgi:hypothetical protein
MFAAIASSPALLIVCSDQCCAHSFMDPMGARPDILPSGVNSVRMSAVRGASSDQGSIHMFEVNDACSSLDYLDVYAHPRS